MRKLRLELEMLMVESFDTSHARAGGGTVRGHNDTVDAEIGNGEADPYSPFCGPTPLTICETCQTNCGTCNSCVSCYSCNATECGYTCPVVVCDPPPPTYPRCPF